MRWRSGYRTWPLSRASPAADRGFKTGDVILQVGGKSVASVKDVRDALSDAHTQGKHDVLMRVRTADGTRFIAVPLATG